MDEQDEIDAKEIKFIQRIQARAGLRPVRRTAPETLLTAREFSRIMGVRALRAGQLNPPGLVLIGCSKRAPFREWLAQLEKGEPPRVEADNRPSLAELRRPVRHR